MHVISKKPFSEAAKRFPNERRSLMDLYRVLSATRFKTPHELKAVFPSLDKFKYLEGWWVLNLGGNHLRLLAFIQFVKQRFYVKHIVPHAEYEKLTDKYRKQHSRR